MVVVVVAVAVVVGAAVGRVGDMGKAHWHGASAVPGAGGSLSLGRKDGAVLVARWQAKWQATGNSLHGQAGTPAGRQGPRYVGCTGASCVHSAWAAAQDKACKQGSSIVLCWQRGPAGMLWLEKEHETEGSQHVAGRAAACSGSSSSSSSGGLLLRQWAAPQQRLLMHMAAGCHGRSSGCPIAAGW